MRSHASNPDRIARVDVEYFTPLYPCQERGYADDVQWTDRITFDDRDLCTLDCTRCRWARIGRRPGRPVAFCVPSTEWSDDTNTDIYRSNWRVILGDAAGADASWDERCRAPFKDYTSGRDGHAVIATASALLADNGYWHRTLKGLAEYCCLNEEDAAALTIELAEDMWDAYIYSDLTGDMAKVWRAQGLDAGYGNPFDPDAIDTEWLRETFYAVAYENDGFEADTATSVTVTRWGKVVAEVCRRAVGRPDVDGTV